MICNDCCQDLPPEAFYKSLRTTCKECQKAKMMEVYQRPEYKKKNAQRQRKWRGVPGNGMKHGARLAVRVAVNTGKLIKPDACIVCGSGKDLEGHHEDYTKPLEVAWLCRDCHASYHAIKAKIQGSALSPFEE